MDQSAQHQFSLRLLLAFVLLSAIVFLTWRVIPSFLVRMNMALVALFGYLAGIARCTAPTGDYPIHQRQVAWRTCVCGSLPTSCIVLIMALADRVPFFVFFFIVFGLIAGSVLWLFGCSVSLRAYALRRDDRWMGTFQIVALAISVALLLETAALCVSS